MTVVEETNPAPEPTPVRIGGVRAGPPRSVVLRRDHWRLQPAATVLGLLAFVAYATPDVYASASGLLAALREMRVPSDISPLGRTLGKQLEDASSLGAKWTLVLGRREVSSGTVTLREMDSRKEETVTRAEALKRIGAP